MMPTPKIEPKSESDESDSDVEVMSMPPSPEMTTTNSLVEVDITEEDVKVNDAGSFNANSARRPRRNTPKVYYGENNSDNEDENKILEKQERQQLTTSMYLFNIFNGDRTAKLDPKVTHVSFVDIQLDDGPNGNNWSNFLWLCDTNSQISSISLKSVTPRLLNEVKKRLPKLKILTIVEEPLDMDTTIEQVDTSNTIQMNTTTFKNLTTVYLTGTNNFLKNDRNLSKLLTNFYKTIKELHYTFASAPDASRFLSHLNQGTNFKAVQTLTLTSSKLASDEQNDKGGLLQKEQIHLLTSLNLNDLRKLELNCGIWEDVTAIDLANLLQKFASTLQHFAISENFQGVDLADRQIKLQVPRMDKLESFSMGNVYEFTEDIDVQSIDSDDENEDDESARRSSRHTLVSLDKPDIIAIDVSFCQTPTLQFLSLGNRIFLDSISPSMFPELKTLHIGSDWTLTLKIPSPSEEIQNPSLFPVFPHVRTLQLPDWLRNEFFMLNLCKMFPVLEKVKMQYPTMKCLRYFFHAMANSSLRTLHLETACDFKGMLENALFPQSTRPSASTDRSLRKLFALKNSNGDTTVFQEFVRDKGIEIPIWTEFIDDKIIKKKQHSLADLKCLKTLILGHLPRQISIPKNNTISYKDKRQTFSSRHKIGFRHYPLSEHFVKNDLQKVGVENFCVRSNIKLPCEYRPPNLVAYTANGSYNYRDKNEQNFNHGGDRDFDFESYSMPDADETIAIVGNLPIRDKKRKLTVSRASAMATMKIKVKKEEDIKPPIRREVKTEI